MTKNAPLVKVFLSILLPIPVGKLFDYSHFEALSPGTLVKVPFGPRELYGIVWEAASTPSTKSIKPILTSFDHICLPETSLKFIDWVSEYTMSSRGQILKMVLPIPEAFEKKEKRPPKEPPSPFPPPQKPRLSEDQAHAAKSIKQALDSHQFHTYLLEGVTGAGKTEVYFEAIEEVLQTKGQALVMLPEIVLSAQWLARFEARFGFQPAVWHSSLGKAQRRTTFRNLLEEKVSLIVGTRSALFLPFTNLKLIIVDEEHDGSYKQEEGVIYNGRDMAVVRAQLSGATCILTSATPSLETEANIRTGKYQHLHLKARYGGASLPQIKVVDLRAVKMAPQEWISPPLRMALQRTLEGREQAMLFLNRRGYAPLILCRNCGDRLMCPQCSVTLVQHKFQDKLLCHHCGHMRALPSTCGGCQETETYTPLGPGVERLYEEVKSFLPQSRCLLMTSDYLNTPQKIFDEVQKIQNHEVDIIIGTQMMAKGHHFPLLTLVGVVDGDSALSGSDLRASEKAFQLLHQVAGRSGRDQRPGQVFLQTYGPNHPVIKALVAQNKEEFFALESQQRHMHGFPPYGRLAALILSGAKGEEVQKAALKLAKTFPLTQKAQLLGPAPAPLSYLRGKHRWRLLIKTAKTYAPQSLLKEWLAKSPLPSSVRLTIDIDPFSFV